jgi:hypothetical protein
VAIDIDSARLWRELHSIAQEVVQDLFETDPISIDVLIAFHLLLDLDIFCHCQRPDCGENLR